MKGDKIFSCEDIFQMETAVHVHVIGGPPYCECFLYQVGFNCFHLGLFLVDVVVYIFTPHAYTLA